MSVEDRKLVMGDWSRVVRDPLDVLRLLFVFALGLAVGALWEIFEYTSDGTFGSALREGNTDTVGDLIADATGSLAGGG